MKTDFLRRILAAVSFVSLMSSLASAADGRLEYNRDIRPILSENCFACHGFDEKARQAELRLDLAEAAYADRDGTVAIKPGDPSRSEVWRRITSNDPDEVMPPPKSRLSLTAAEKEKLRRWIEQGAEYAGHWSLQPIRRPPIPEVRGQGPGARGERSEVRGQKSGATDHGPRTTNPIDAFVRAQLEQDGLRPANEANRSALIRRVSLDLTGLPPSAEEIEAFVHDSDPKAYERLVERLLESPHFGERMALVWLDAARYADTNGFSIDGGRHMWLWRDWVIQAFNDNKPYNRFLVEQLAGDLLPEHGEAELIATGFQRNNMVTHEWGTIPEENLTNYNADRVKTLGEAVLGLTLGCAQCHDHKYDPITQRDYYRLFAFFNTLDDRGLDGNGGVNPNPSIEAHTVLRTDEEPQLRERIAALHAEFEQPHLDLLKTWEEDQQKLLAARGKDLKPHALRVLKVSTPNRGAGFEMEDGSRVRIRAVGDLAAFDISAEMPPLVEPVTGLRVIVYPQPEFPGGGWGGGPVTRRPRNAKTPGNDQPEKGTFRLTAIAATADAVPGDQVNLHKLQPIERVTASSWDPQYPPAGCLDPRNDTGWSPDLSAEGPVHLTVTFAEPINTNETPYLTTQLNFGFGQSLLPGLVEIVAMTGTDDGTALPPEVVAILNTYDIDRTPRMNADLWRYCAAHAPRWQAKRTELANLEERLAVLTEKFPTMVMNVAAKPRKTFILQRGDYSKPTEEVTPGTPAALPPLPEGAAVDRLALARWLVADNHPLTARVAVNRFWQMLFGTGLVATPADFGSQGEWPSHPDLLDWLAVEFIESGWDVKHLLRLIVASETYRQSSDASAELLERDPANRLLARGPRFRLPAELIRDQSLKVSGLLVPRIGGPSVNPYTPGDLWREVSHYGSTPATAQAFVQDHGEKLYRRSLYTYWKRTVPPPNLTVFDAPNREVCTIARPTTTTPLQALVLLNDVQFVEASRAFAERILHHEGDDAERLRWAMLESLSRPPSEREMKILHKALTRERERYRHEEPAATAYLSVGESPRDTSLPVAEHAAWSQVAAMLMNLSEFVTRE